MKKAAIIPANGIGDSLIFLIVANALKNQGFDVTFYDERLQELSSWLPPYTFVSKLTLSSFDGLERFDRVIVQNDNSAYTKAILKAREQKKLCEIAILYPTYKIGKHPPLHSEDFVCNDSIPLVENVAIFLQSHLGTQEKNTDNALTPHQHLFFRKQPQTVIIHPESSNESKNWPLKSFLKLAQSIEDKGFNVKIPAINAMQASYIPTKWLLKTPLLSDLASAIYEAGYVIGNDSLACHLASNLNIPSLVIADCKSRMALWQPGWLRASVVVPKTILLRFYSLLNKKTAWKKAITVRHALNKFILITLQNN